MTQYRGIATRRYRTIGSRHLQYRFRLFFTHFVAVRLGYEKKVSRPRYVSAKRSKFQHTVIANGPIGPAPPLKRRGEISAKHEST